MLEELADLWAVAKLLSHRLAALEAQRPGERPQAGPEGPRDCVTICTRSIGKMHSGD
jgi:hypothetical protein